MIPPSSPTPKHKWPSAEDEKKRMFEDAQRRAVMHQRGESFTSTPSRNTSFGSQMTNHTARIGSPSPNNLASPTPRSGAALYASAMSAVNASRNAASESSTPTITPTPSPRPNKVSSPPPPASTPPLSIPQSAPPHTRTFSNGSARYYPTAEEEKAALRYAQAKKAVEANYVMPPKIDSEMVTSQGGPIPYDQLFPEARMTSMFPHITSVYLSCLTASSTNGSSSSAHDSYRTSNATATSSSLSRSGSSREYVERSPASPPPANLPRRRPSLPTPPGPPGIAPTSRPLSAAEEKALLKARYEAEEVDTIAEADEPEASGSGLQSMRDSYPEGIISHYTRQSYAPSSLSRDPTIRLGKQRAVTSTTPPPLMPKPPSDYIQETQAADLRIRSQLDDSNASSLLHEPERAQSPFKFSLDMRPFSPFDVGLTNITMNTDIPPVPPVPPKIPISN